MVTEMQAFRNRLNAEFPTAVKPEPVNPPSNTGITLKSLLAKFPTSRGNSNKWPGLRVAAESWRTFRVILSNDGSVAIAKGAKGSDARKEFAEIDLASGVVKILNSRADKLKPLLEALWRDPVSFCDVHGKVTHVCCFCAAQLSTKESTERGYGPVCASRFGLPWGDRANDIPLIDLFG